MQIYVLHINAIIYEREENIRFTEGCTKEI